MSGIFGGSQQQQQPVQQAAPTVLPPPPSRSASETDAEASRQTARFRASRTTNNFLGGAQSGTPSLTTRFLGGG